MIDGCAFVTITTENLAGARSFWVDRLGLALMEEVPDRYFIVAAGALRLCVDLRDPDAAEGGDKDPTIALTAPSVVLTLAELSASGVEVLVDPEDDQSGAYGVVQDPDGHLIIITNQAAPRG